MYRFVARATAGVVVGELSGKAGNAVFVQTARGLVVRGLPRVNNPQTSSQCAIRGVFAEASRAWKGLTPAQAEAWRTYALAQPGGRSAYALFVGLTAKYLQLHPQGAAPVNPPSHAFFGDGLAVAASSSSPGVVTFTASAASQSGVTVELLIQRLAHANRLPKAREYRTLAFHAYAPGALAFSQTVPKGVYACAYRFVEVSSGQSSNSAPCGIVVVG